MEKENQTSEDRMAQKLVELESQHKTKLTEFQQTLSKASLRQVEAVSSEIADLKTRIQFERDLREGYWTEFKDKLSPEDFSALWETSLRENALIRGLPKADKIKGDLQVYRNRYWRNI